MTKGPDHRPLKSWVGLAAAAAAGLAAVAVTPAHAASTGEPGGRPTTASLYLLAQAVDGSELASSSEVVQDDAAFLTLLGLVEGHLRVGIELYRLGAADMARTHMKHPSDELYVDLEPALAARRIDGFADALERLAVAVEGGRSLEEANAAFEAVIREISRAHAAARPGLPAKLRAIVDLVHTAAEEYAVGVKDGRVSDPHEYQDAWGFTQAATAMMEALSEAERRRMGQGFDRIVAELQGLAKAWPSLVPPDAIATDAGFIHAAAARIELATLAVK